VYVDDEEKRERKKKNKNLKFHGNQMAMHILQIADAKKRI
jgi:hypothetical protein